MRIFFSITGDSFTNDFYFGNADSKRLRIGGRFINNTADNWKLFYGAAYEYEFDGRTNISTQDEIIDDDGGIGEVRLLVRLALIIMILKILIWILMPICADIVAIDKVLVPIFKLFLKFKLKAYE